MKTNKTNKDMLEKYHLKAHYLIQILDEYFKELLKTYLNNPEIVDEKFSEITPEVIHLLKNYVKRHRLNRTNNDKHFKDQILTEENAIFLIKLNEDIDLLKRYIVSIYSSLKKFREIPYNKVVTNLEQFIPYVYRFLFKYHEDCVFYEQLNELSILSSREVISLVGKYRGVLLMSGFQFEEDI